jgi:hypothetical protein
VFAQRSSDGFPSRLPITLALLHLTSPLDGRGGLSDATDEGQGLSIIDSALATREERTERAGAICPLCGRLFRRAGRLCKPCASRCERQALAQQKRDYLAAWLSTRDEDRSLLAERLRAKARSLGVDWLFHDASRAPLLYKDRLEQVSTAGLCWPTRHERSPRGLHVLCNPWRRGLRITSCL